MLLDRLAERAALGRLLEAARSGQSGALVVRGEPGVGKTALLENAIESAAGLSVARVAGVESEMELAFAALQHLCAPMLDRMERLPGPQRDALGAAFGLRTGNAPDRFLVGLAALSLLSEVSGDRPLLRVIDDAHWLDRASAQALGFVARRLLAESVVLVVATREPGGEFAGLPELRVEGLGHDAARQLLGSVIAGPMDERVRERIIAETEGNPLALLELPRALTPAELAGGFSVPGTPGLSGRIEDSFRRRLEALPASTQRLLVIAAAEPTGDPVLMWRAAEWLGIGVAAAAAAEAGGLLTIGERVAFRHPLVRSAVYGAASPQERQAVHRALASATDPAADPDRRAWHRALATIESDEEVAFELERSAARAQARGGATAAAAFLERSAALTPGRARRAERALAAAQAKYQAGAFEAALGLLAAAEAGPLDELERARADLLRGQIAFASSRGSEAPPLLLKAARQLEQLDVRLARDTYLEALSAALFAGRLTSGGDLLEVAEAARKAPLPPLPPRATDRLLDGLAVLITEGYRPGVPMLKRAVSAFRGTDVSSEEGLRWLWHACHAAGLVWDYQNLDMLSACLVKLARDAGALQALPVALSTRALVHLFAGEFGEADSLAVQVESITKATRSSIAPYLALALAAWRGRPAEASELIEAAAADVQRRGEGGWLNSVQWLTAVLGNGLGRYEDALAAAQEASEDSPARWFFNWAIVELIEAAARSGVPDRATDALERLSQTARASGTDWALGVDARSRALVSEGESAESLYREAISRLARTRLRVERGRAHLLYGEWLRRERRTRDARDQLRSAYEIFDSCGAGAFLGRARAELRAAGGHPSKRAVETDESLTSQEELIARLASGGGSNAEIAAQLCISPATVAYHLGKVYAKLGISSRNKLARALPEQPDAARRSAATGRAG
jgi:DNA-binding CsgD family transcriptional regulator